MSRRKNYYAKTSKLRMKNFVLMFRNYSGERVWDLLCVFQYENNVRQIKCLIYNVKKSS